MKSSSFVVAVAALLPIAAAIAQTPPTEPAQPEQKGVTFESLDTDSDGRISKTEAAANAHVTAQFTRYDQNGDGFLEREEVISANKGTAEKPPQQ
jgi:Ca2+-binding EF-hand superfamily protein